MPILIILFIGGLLLYAVIPVTIDFVNLQYTGKSTLLQMWGHFILSNMAIMDITDIEPLFMAVYELLEENGIFVFWEIALPPTTE